MKTKNFFCAFYLKIPSKHSSNKPLFILLSVSIKGSEEPENTVELEGSSYDSGLFDNVPAKHSAFSKCNCSLN